MRHTVDILTRDGRVVAEGSLVEYYITEDSLGFRSWAGRVLDRGHVLNASALDDDPRPRVLRLSDGREGEANFDPAFTEFQGTGRPPHESRRP